MQFGVDPVGGKKEFSAEKGRPSEQSLKPLPPFDGERKLSAIECAAKVSEYVQRMAA